MAKYDLTGQKFNRLTVIKENGKNKRNQILWECECECGNITNVITYNLRKGITNSCGCYNRDITRKQARKLGKKNTTHNMSGTRIYKTYMGIRERCLNKNSKKFPYYGGRGIKLCKEWNTFEKFYEWAIPNGYKDDLTLDRIDVNGNYEPNNCRWANAITQSNNKRDNVFYTYKGKTQTVSQWAREYGIKEVTLRARLNKSNIPFEEAISLSSFECRSLKHGKKVKVINIETKEEFKYNSLKSACDDLDHENNYSKIRYCFQNNKIYLNKYKIERY